MAAVAKVSAQPRYAAPMKNTDPVICPCNTKRPYSLCCEPYHQGTPAPTAETLMRSRYSAYALRLEDYVFATWHPSTRPASLDQGSGINQTTWLGLDMKRVQRTGDDTATVEFVARYRVGGASAVRLHEVSRFVREAGKWLYLDGEEYEKVPPLPWGPGSRRKSVV
jgi:SEC-C motif domain protein